MKDVFAIEEHKPKRIFWVGRSNTLPDATWVSICTGIDPDSVWLIETREVEGKQAYMITIAKPRRTRRVAR